MKNHRFKLMFLISVLVMTSAVFADTSPAVVPDSAENNAFVLNETTATTISKATALDTSPVNALAYSVTAEMVDGIYLTPNPQEAAFNQQMVFDVAMRLVDTNSFNAATFKPGAMIDDFTLNDAGEYDMPVDNREAMKRKFC